MDTLNRDEYLAKEARGMRERGPTGLQEHVRRLVQTHVRIGIDRGVLFYHTQDSRNSPRGFPDVMIGFSEEYADTQRPRLVVAELKTENGRPTLDQVRWLDHFSTLPAVEVYLWRPRHFLTDEIANILCNRFGVYKVTCAWARGRGVHGDPYSLPKEMQRGKS